MLSRRSFQHLLAEPVEEVASPFLCKGHHLCNIPFPHIPSAQCNNIIIDRDLAPVQGIPDLEGHSALRSERDVLVKDRHPAHSRESFFHFLCRERPERADLEQSDLLPCIPHF